MITWILHNRISPQAASQGRTAERTLRSNAALEAGRQMRMRTLAAETRPAIIRAEFGTLIPSSLCQPQHGVTLSANGYEDKNAARQIT